MATTPTEFDIDAAARRVLGMIREDIAAGKVPASVANFTELHGHVDANQYLEQAGIPYGADLPEDDDDIHGNRLLNATEDRVNELLRGVDLADGAVDIDAAARRVLDMIREDIAAEHLPADVATFAQVREHCDEGNADIYMRLAQVPEDARSAVQDRVDALMADATA